MQYQPKLKRRFIECVHYVSSSILAKNKKFLKESPKKVMTILAIPFGTVLTGFIKLQAKKYMKIKV